MYPNNKERQNYVSQLESKLMQQEQTEQQLKRLISEANVLKQQKNIKDAIQNMNRHNHIKAQPEIKERIALLQNYVKQQEDLQQKINYAYKLRTEGEALQKANRIQDAINKYRESLK